MTVAYISYLVLGFSFDYMDIPKNSFLPAMTANPKERSSLGMLIALGTIVSGMVVAIIAPLILAAGDLSLKAFYTLVLIITERYFPNFVLGKRSIKYPLIGSLMPSMILESRKSVPMAMGFNPMTFV